jgi:hypothetical protein
LIRLATSAKKQFAVLYKKARVNDLPGLENSNRYGWMMEGTMNSFGMFRISMIVPTFAAAMFVAPQCRAQFEIDRDHFDGTDSWQAAALAKAYAPKTNRVQAGAAGQALNGNTTGRATLRPTAARNVPNAQGPELAAVQDKRKASTRKERHR